MTAPTLIVGLGGIGSKIVAILSDRITDDKQRERISFVVFDTDVNDLNDIKMKHPHIGIVQTSTNMTVGNYLHYDKHTRDTSFPINPNLNRKTLTEGAGQVRAISHLAFVTAMKNNQMEQLEQAINKLYSLKFDSLNQSLRVIIVSTLAGGTGSGLILPVSMYIKNFLNTRKQILGSVTRGFFILPETLYNAVPAEVMRNAFKANAYAVLRELNAFMLKADDNLPERYKNKVKLEFPKIGTDGWEEYDVLPMDFCFMFDAQNVEGGQLLTTQQYLQHAATCIYAQAIGPMNRKSNSQEDNVIRTLVSGRSRNRYAGAGASELVYPSNHVQNYIALKWAEQTITKSWTMFDIAFKERNKQNNRARLKGQAYDPDITPEKIYIETVDEVGDKKEPNPFAAFVKRASYDFEKDGFTQRGGPKWDAYIKALNDYVDNNAEKYKNTIAKAKGDAENPTRKLQINDSSEEKTMQLLDTAYTSLKYYRDLVKRRVADIGSRAIYSIFDFDDGKDVTDTTEEIRIEFHMKDETGKFMHPNAIRYFLYQTLRAIRSKLVDNEKKKLELEESFDAFDELFDDPTTKDVKEEIGHFITKIKSNSKVKRLLNKISGAFDSQIKQKTAAYDMLFNNVSEYWQIAPYVTVLKSARDHVEKLCKSFEKFYNSFDSNVSEINRQIKTSEEQYEWKDGNTIRYVCSTKKCLDRFYDKMEFTGSAIDLNDDLCRKIYKKVKSYSKTSEDTEASDFFRNLFSDDILKYFKDSVEDEYGMDIKMDIIRALEVEAEYEEGLQNKNDITEYARKVIKATKKLADPFINRPVGEAVVPIPACAYNKNLIIKDNPEREEFVNKELFSFGGEPCDDKEGVSIDRILFYSAIYGLYPEQLLKFSPPDKSQTGGPEAGEYYNAYWDMVNKMDPNPLETKVITPHLHKHWHLISEMPALGTEEQTKCEKKIYRALILGFVYNMIKLEKGGIYSLDIKTNKMLITLEVSNGTDCDSFYEVVDALTINPVLVNEILEAVDKTIETDRKDNKVKFEETALSKGLKALKLSQIISADQVSIFGIAIAYKVTTPPDEFVEDQGQLLLETALETLYDQVNRLCPENERDSAFVDLIESQLEIFKKNIKSYKEKYQSATKDYLKALLHRVKVFFYEKGFTEASNKVAEYADTYSDDN